MTVGIFEVDVFRVFQKHLGWKTKVNRAQPLEDGHHPTGNERREESKVNVTSSPQQAAQQGSANSQEMPANSQEMMESAVIKRMRELVENWREDGRIVGRTLDSSIRFSAAYEVFAADLDRELDEIRYEAEKDTR